MRLETFLVLFDLGILESIKYGKSGARQGLQAKEAIVAMKREPQIID